MSEEEESGSVGGGAATERPYAVDAAETVVKKRGPGRPKGAITNKKGAAPAGRARGRPRGAAAVARSAGKGRSQTAKSPTSSSASSSPQIVNNTKKRKISLTPKASPSTDEVKKNSKEEVKKKRGPGRPPRSSSDTATENGTSNEKVQPAAKRGRLSQVAAESESSSSPSSNGSDSPSSPSVRGRPRGRPRGRSGGPRIASLATSHEMTSSPLVEPMDEIENEIVSDDPPPEKQLPQSEEITPRKIHKKFGKFRSLNSENSTPTESESGDVANEATPTPPPSRPLRKSARFNQPEVSEVNSAPAPPPMKVKSRWRRSSELETSTQSDHSSDEPLVPINSYLKENKDFKKSAVDINDTPEVKLELAKRLKSFSHIVESRWLCER